MTDYSVYPRKVINDHFIIRYPIDSEIILETCQILVLYDYQLNIIVRNEFLFSVSYFLQSFFFPSISILIEQNVTLNTHGMNKQESPYWAHWLSAHIPMTL